MVANLTVDRGITTHNMTLSTSVTERLGHGCHNLTLTASNKVTVQTVSSQMELCLLEPVEGLQASVTAGEDECPDSMDLTFNVSLERGEPVELLFTLTGARDNISETRDMRNSSLQAFTFSSPLEGTWSFCWSVNEMKTVAYRMLYMCLNLLNIYCFVKDYLR